ncbi:MAG: AraC family transcriptional regulator [Mangrovimonas sp.]|nr:AraC family transcriptional regulator [Mangrovimonas sp.]
MKPRLETLSLPSKQQSFNAFSIHADSFEPYWHYHPELELTLITKGQGTRFVGDNISPFGDNDLVLVGENLPHHWVSITNENTSVGAVVIQFPKSIFEAFPECDPFKLLFNKTLQGLHFTKPSQAIIKKMTVFNSLDKPSQLSALISILHELSLESSKSVVLSSKTYRQNFRESKYDSKVSKCTSYILEHLNDSLNVSMMAEKMHMTPPSFCRWFKKHIGLSFVTFLNKSRVESACHYLATTDAPIQDIAFMVGFESLSHFNRTFKNLKEVSPRLFRLKIQPNPQSWKPTGF